MPIRNYRLLLGLVASLSLALTGCGSDNAGPAAAGARVASNEPDTESTIFTVLGLAKRNPEMNVGPQTGASVSPVLWQAAEETLGFAGVASEDPVTGLLMTNWYSPPNKPRERLRVSVFILSRALRSDSASVTVERQERTPSGQWQDTPVARDTVAALENAILQRARQIHAERYRNTMYN
jgi:hypothetical protein